MTDGKTLNHFIGGEWTATSGGAIFEVLNPLDDSLYCHAAHGTAADMNAAVAAAKAAFASRIKSTNVPQSIG